ncbi:MAG: MFS transporter [Acidobacteria bacterium]|nr:MFS transporter [Acidobacteriota bacterium]
MVSTVSADVETRCVHKLFWRLLPFLFLLYVVNYLDRINVGFAALQMQTQLHFTDRVYGLGAGIFFAGYFLFQVPSNLAMAHVGARRWIAGIMVLWGLISCCMVFVRTGREFYALRFVLGAAEAGFFPGVILYLKNWFPASARARAVALFMTANPVSGVIGGPLSGALLGLHQFGIAGWQWMFVIEGLPSIALAALVLLALTDIPEAATWLGPDERLWLTGNLRAERERHVQEIGADLRAALTRLSGKLLLLTVTYFGITTTVYGTILWLPNFIHSLSTLSNFGIGVVSMIPYMATAISMVLIGIQSDRTGRHRLYLALTAFAAALFMFLAAQTRSMVPGLAFVSLALMSASSMQGPFWATATSLMSGTAAAAGIALINSFGNLGGFFGPYIIGAKRSSGMGFRGGMLIISAFLALAGIVSLLVRAFPPGQRYGPRLPSTPQH